MGLEGGAIWVRPDAESERVAGQDDSRESAGEGAHVGGIAFECARDGRACDAIAAKAVQDRAIEARRPGEARVDMKRVPVARTAVDERGARRHCGAGEIGRANARPPVTNAHIVYRLLL